MPTKSLRFMIISIVSLIIFFTFISSSMVYISQESRKSISLLYEDENNTDLKKLMIKIKGLKSIAQDDPINTTKVETNTTETTEDETGLPSWKPFLVDENLYYPLALIFSALGIFSTLWFVFFVETSKDRTIRERIIGTTIRLIFMSLFLGLALHFWILFDPI